MDYSKALRSSHLQAAFRIVEMIGLGVLLWIIACSGIYS
jgi:hypothetical protein